MKSDFFYTPEFAKALKKLRKKYRTIDNDLKELSKEIINNPDIGTDLGNGLRKIRLKITAKNKGKSGGARVITEDIIIDTGDRNILFIIIYDKSDVESFDIEKIKDILEAYTTNQQNK